MKLGHSIEESKAKYSELTDELLEDLKKWTEQKGIPEVSLEMLALSAHSCYFEREATIRCIEVYYRMRATVPEFFANRDPRLDSLQHSLRALQFAALPMPDKDGDLIVFHRLMDCRPNQYMFNDGIKLLFMTVDASLYANGCTSGFSFLFDMRGVRLGHLTRLSISSIRKFFEYVQEGLPVRLKGIHILNAVWFMDKVLSLIRPFMKKELFEMLHLYTGDVSEIYERIPPKSLPKDFGGELDSVDNLHEAHCLTLDKLRDCFLEEERLFRLWDQDSRTSPSSMPPQEVCSSPSTGNGIPNNET